MAKGIQHITFAILHFSVSGSVKTELCDRETFQPQCSSGEVVVITSAIYGRMHKGRCLQSDIQLGCVADALSFMDRRCSGLPTCTLTLDYLNKDLREISQCPGDVISYMEIDHECVQGKAVDIQVKHDYEGN